jgi:predicted nucleic-acid-binding protein
MKAFYNTSRNEIIGTFREILSMPLLKFESQPAIQAFAISAMSTSVDLGDPLIARLAHHSGGESVLTLDKRASKSELFELLR